MILRRALVVVLLLAPASGALAASQSVREQVDSIEMDLRDLQQKVLEMQEVQASIQKSIADLRAALNLDSPNRRTPADLAARLDSVETDLRVVQEGQNEAQHRIGVLSDKVDTTFRRQAQLEQSVSMMPPQGPPDPNAAPATPPVDEEPVGARGGDATPAPAASPKSAVTEPMVDPEELYQAARADYGRGSYDLALSGFEDFLERFPQSELADNAAYWVGECHYSAGRWEQAVAAFDRVLTEYPDADKTPDAAYKKGLALLEMQETAKGIVQLQAVKDRWPASPAARLAAAKLQSMGLQ